MIINNNTSNKNSNNNNLEKNIYLLFILDINYNNCVLAIFRGPPFNLS